MVLLVKARKSKFHPLRAIEDELRIPFSSVFFEKSCRDWQILNFKDFKNLYLKTCIFNLAFRPTKCLWSHKVLILWNTLPPCVHLFFGLEFTSKTAHENFLIFLHEFVLWSNLKSDKVGVLGQKGTKWAQNEVHQVFKKYRCVKSSDFLDEVYATWS